jgi:hypothetical protein
MARHCSRRFPAPRTVIPWRRSGPPPRSLTRHPAGYVLHFPRIVRVRDDKPAGEIDVLARVRALARIFSLTPRRRPD